MDFASLYIEHELKAVMKLKLKFFEWFEAMLQIIVTKHNEKALKKMEGRGIEESCPAVQEEDTHDLIQFMA